MASSDSEIDKAQCGCPKRAELPDVNILRELLYPFQSQAHNANSPNHSRRKWLSGVVRNDCPINFHFEQAIYCCQILHTVWYISGETDRENWSWSLLGVKELTFWWCKMLCFRKRIVGMSVWITCSSQTSINVSISSGILFRKYIVPGGCWVDFSNWPFCVKRRWQWLSYVDDE